MASLGKRGRWGRLGRPDGHPGEGAARRAGRQGRREPFPFPGGGVAGPLGQNPCRRRGLQWLDTGPRRLWATATCAPTLPSGSSVLPFQPVCPKAVVRSGSCISAPVVLSPFPLEGLFLFLLLFPPFTSYSFFTSISSFSVYYFFFSLRFLSSVFFSFLSLSSCPSDARVSLCPLAHSTLPTCSVTYPDRCSAICSLLQPGLAVFAQIRSRLTLKSQSIFL